jgi:hypothetical protein
VNVSVEIVSRALIFFCFSLLWLCDANFTDVGRMCLMEAITFVSIRVSSNVTNDPEKHQQPLE